MIVKLLFRHFHLLLLCVILCSFAYFEKDIELEKNELSYSDTKTELNFGGLERLLDMDDSECFRTDIYLSDIDLNDAGFNSNEQIVLVLRNHMMANEFINGLYSISGLSKTDHSSVEVELFTINGKKTNLEVTSGIVQYEGTYPQIKLTFDLLLNNSESLKGSYFKEMKPFKYFF